MKDGLMVRANVRRLIKHHQQAASLCCWGTAHRHEALLTEHGLQELSALLAAQDYDGAWAWFDKHYPEGRHVV